MTIASITDTPYRIMLLLHLFAVTIGFGAVFTNKIYAAQVAKRSGAGALAVAEANFAVTKLFEKVIYLVPIFGFGLMGMSDDAWKFSQTWLWLSLLLYLAGVGVAHAMMIPGARKMNEVLAAAGDGAAPAAELDPITKRLATGGMFLDLLLVVIFVLMIWKPGS